MGQAFPHLLRNAFWLVLAALVPGCGSPAFQTDIGPLQNGVKLKILAPAAPHNVNSSSRADSSGYFFAWERGDLKVEVEYLRMTIGGHDYGMLKAGDFVVVDARRQLKVMVNGADRKPIVKDGQP